MKKTLIACLAIFCLLMACKEDEPSTDGPENTNEEVEGTLSVSPSEHEISAGAGTCYFSVTSNTDWTVYPNNSCSNCSIDGLEVTPLEGTGNKTIKVEYDAVPSPTYYNEYATIVFFYYSYGIKYNKTVTVRRKSY